jgi:predicted metal-binding protein
VIRAPQLPRVHLFVCANVRADDNPLGPGCGEAGERVFKLLKEESLRRGMVHQVWVTKAFCMGICPKRGATVARHAEDGRGIFRDVDESDAITLLEDA